MASQDKPQVLLPIFTNLATDYRCYKIAVSMQKMGYEPVILCDKPFSPLGKQWSAFRIIFLTPFSHKDNFKLVYLLYLLKLFFYLLFTKSSLWISEDCPPLLLCAFIAKLRGKTVIYDSHELFLEVASVTRNKLNKTFWSFWQHTGVHFIQKIITVSPDYRKHLSALYPDKQFFLLPNLPNRGKDTITIKKVAVPPIILIYQGYIRPDASLGLLLEAVRHQEKYHLIFAGGGSECEALQRQAKHLKIDHRVEFPGIVPFESLPQITARAHIGINLLKPLSTSLDLTLPNKIFEYIHQGLPVLMSRTSANINFLKKHPVGVLADLDTPESVLKGLETIAADYQRYAKASLEAREELNWEQYENGLKNFITA